MRCKDLKALHCRYILQLFLDSVNTTGPVLKQVASRIKQRNTLSDDCCTSCGAVERGIDFHGCFPISGYVIACFFVEVKKRH